MGGRRVNLEANNTGVFPQRQDHPIAEMMIERNENPIFINCCLQYLKIIRPFLANFTCTQNIVAFTR